MYPSALNHNLEIKYHWLTRCRTARNGSFQVLFQLRQLIDPRRLPAELLGISTVVVSELYGPTEEIRSEKLRLCCPVFYACYLIYGSIRFSPSVQARWVSPLSKLWAGSNVVWSISQIRVLAAKNGGSPRVMVGHQQFADFLTHANLTPILLWLTVKTLVRLLRERAVS